MIDGRVILTDPIGWEKRDRNRPRCVIQFLTDGIRFARAIHLAEAQWIKDDWLKASYSRFPGEIRKFSKVIA